MSGSSGGGYTPSFESSPSKVPCNELAFHTTVASPDPVVVPTLKKGDTLEVILTPAKKIELHDKNGDVAGGLLSPYRDTLINCIEQGIDYVATILEISGSIVKIKVHIK